MLAIRDALGVSLDELASTPAQVLLTAVRDRAQDDAGKAYAQILKAVVDLLTARRVFEEMVRTLSAEPFNLADGDKGFVPLSDLTATVEGALAEALRKYEAMTSEPMRSPVADLTREIGGDDG